jgi:hypothetical protein
MVVTSKLRTHKVMEAAIRELMGAGTPPRFKFQDTYESIEFPSGYTIPAQATLEAKYDELLALEEDIQKTVAEGDLEVGTSNLFVDTETGNVGIGTNSPGFSLDVHGTANVGALTATSVSGPLSGNATTATALQTARNINGVSFDGSVNITITANTPNTLTRGSYLTGSNFNGSAATTWAVDATEAATTSKIVARNSSGDINCRLVRPNYTNQTTISGAMAYRINNSSDNYIRFCSDKGAIRTFLDVPTRTGGDASGTWGIDITGNAGTATTATNQSGGTVTCTSGTFSGTFSASTASSRDKFRVYPSSSYCIGMQSGVTYGDLNDWSMTFQMNNDNDRGFWWGDDSHGVNQGAMALSTRGWLNVAERIKVGGGQTDTDGPSYPLHVVGDVYASGNITAYSDRRAKSDIAKIENALDKIDQLNGYTYTMNDERYTGLIAQEVLPVLPEAVVGSEETSYAIAYGNMAGLFVEAMKEMKSKLDTALARLDALENQD